jgi:hypothetical protein
MRFRHDIENEDGDVIDSVTVEAHFSPYVPAFTSGKPEDCYPAEGGEIEDLHVFHGLKGITDTVDDLYGPGTLDRIREAARDRFHDYRRSQR